MLGVEFMMIARWFTSCGRHGISDAIDVHDAILGINNGGGFSLPSAMIFLLGFTPLAELASFVALAFAFSL